MYNRVAKIEAWALNLVEMVQASKTVEDSRVELKREWPEPVKAARRIAGHANSSFGSDILWIIGLDEDEGVIGVEPEDLANWWPRVCSYFDGIPPSLTDLVISVPGNSLVCLLLETNRPPYVVKNPVYGLSGGGPVAWEVPWRDGTSTRTATRNDLVRVLVPTVAQPEVEVLNGTGRFTPIKPEYFHRNIATAFRLAFSLSVYLYPRDESRVAIPFHKCKCVLTDSKSEGAIDEFEFTMHLPHSIQRVGSSPDTVTIERTSSELIAHGPGKCRIDVNTVLDAHPEWLQSDDLSLRVVLYVIDSELPVEITQAFKQAESSSDTIMEWSIECG